MSGKIALSLLCVIGFCTGLVYMLAAYKETTKVDTDDGTFIGYIRRFHAFEQDFKVRRFLGIPYAEAPVGNLRFEKPKRKAKLTEPYDATIYRPSCMQQLIEIGGQRKPGIFDNVQMSEDCLFLNVFAPETDAALYEHLPVMIYIHGGGFVAGSPNLYSSDILSVYGNVVVVVIAYRLSIWGFLSTGDETLPGNYGLWDQQMAIQWVHDNIANFGGDPDLVTLFGTSAGGTSAVYQGLFPGNKGLIQRVIPQSGTITCPWAINKNPLPTAKRLGRLVGCGDPTSIKELVRCLKSKSTKELAAALASKENTFLRFPMELIPVKDGDFVPLLPTELFHDTSETAKAYRDALRSVDLLTGVVTNEGNVMVSSFGLVENTETFEANKTVFETKLVPIAVHAMFGEKVHDVVNDIVVGEYTNWNNADDSFNSRDSFIKMSGDYMFNVQAVETALSHAENTDRNTYMYLYDALPSRHLMALPPWTDKAQHTDDITTMFGYDNEEGYVIWTTPYTEDPPEQWELELSKAHITMWANFARSGDPNGPVDVTPYIKTTWPKYDKQSQRYLNISRHMTENSVGKRLFARNTNFWLKVLPEVIQVVQHSTTGKAQDYFCERDGGCRP